MTEAARERTASNLIANKCPVSRDGTSTRASDCSAR